MEDTNIWSQVPLADYERHMGHKDVGQAQLLNALTKEFLEKHHPENILFLGISGGNGLEHIDPIHSKQVCGIDINPLYIDATNERYAAKIPQLKLINADINKSTASFIQADFIWVALVLEYVDIQKAFSFIDANASSSSALIITVQVDNGIKSVSETGIESVQAVGKIFTYVSYAELIKIALQFDFRLKTQEEHILPNGKAFMTYEFLRN